MFPAILSKSSILGCYFTYLPCASMAWQSKRDHEAIMTYNKLRKQPLQETVHSSREIRRAKEYFDKIIEYRKKSAEGFEPSKLFMVWRIADLLDRPYWEKELMVELGISGPTLQYAIVKNTPSMNKKLWSVKHLIRIKPITFPNGFPEEGDYSGTVLMPDGELVVSPKLKVDPELLEYDPEDKTKRLDPRTIRENLRLKWDIGYWKMY